MTSKELKRLSRADLLELLLAQTRETETLKKKLQEAEEELENRRFRMSNAGSLAEAMVEINNVMAAAQSAADQYLENIAAMEAETRQKCEKMLQAAANLDFELAAKLRDKLFELQGKSQDEIKEEIVPAPQKKRRQRKPGKYLKA